jgi:hypothetical protein
MTVAEVKDTTKPRNGMKERCARFYHALSRALEGHPRMMDDVWSSEDDLLNLEAWGEVEAGWWACGRSPGK